MIKIKRAANLYLVVDEDDPIAAFVHIEDARTFIGDIGNPRMRLVHSAEAHRARAAMRAAALQFAPDRAS